VIGSHDGVVSVATAPALDCSAPLTFAVSGVSSLSSAAAVDFVSLVISTSVGRIQLRPIVSEAAFVGAVQQACAADRAATGWAQLAQTTRNWLHVFNTFVHSLKCVACDQRSLWDGGF
jgi:hypothetical protein